MFVISDSYGLYFQPPRSLKHFLYCVSEPIVVAKSLLENVSKDLIKKKKKKKLLDGLRDILNVKFCSTIWKVLEDSKD